MPDKKSIERLLPIIQQFLKGNPTQLSEVNRQNHIIFHYYMEILRYFNKINFILNYTLSALGKKAKLTRVRKALYLYIVYRIVWERVSLKEILKEMKSFFMKIPFKLSKKNLTNLYNKLKTFSWKKALKNKTPIEKLSITEAIPTFFIKQIKPYLDFNFLKENLKLMNSPEELNLYFIINTKSEKNYKELSQKVKKSLKNIKIPYRNDKNVEYIYQIPFSYKNDLINSDFNKNGNIIILDKASIYTANLLRPLKDNIICDMCAGPGMKASIINQFLQDSSQLVAAEFQINRVKIMKSLFNLYQMSNISIINTDSISFSLKKGKQFDKILLDAPCTGNGAFSSNPELKWRQNNSFLHQNTILQEKLLQSAINMLKQGGDLIYSTCSFYPQEGELQILKFLDRLDPLPLPNYISSSYRINDKIISGTGRLFPSTNATKGFFIGKFKKNY